MSEQLEIGRPLPVERGRHGLRTGLIAGVTAVVVGGAALGGWQLQQLLSGGGPQPEDVLPASTVAFASLDLDPGAGQKLAAYQLLKKFPDAHVSDQTDLKKKAWEALDDSSLRRLDYGTDVRPWLGDRFAIAAVPAPGTDDGFTPLGVVQVTDQDAAAKAFEKIAETPTGYSMKASPSAAAEPGTEPGTVPGTVSGSAPSGAPNPGAQPVPRDFFWAFEDGYALITDDRSELDAIVAADHHLADSAGFRHDLDSLGGDQVALAWTDLGALWSAAPADLRRDVTDSWGQQVDPAGSLVAGVSLTSTSVDVTGHGFGISAGGPGTTAGLTPGTGLVETLPADSDVVLSVSGLGPMLSQAWQAYGEAGDPLDLADEADGLGVELPDDLEAVFGSEIAIGARLGDRVDFAATARTPDPQRGAEVWRILSGASGDELPPARVDGDRWIAGSSGTSGTLADDADFAAVVPGADHANVVGYIDVPRVEEWFSSFWDGRAEPSDTPLKAAGFSVTGDRQQLDFAGRLLMND